MKTGTIVVDGQTLDFIVIEKLEGFEVVEETQFLSEPREVSHRKYLFFGPKVKRVVRDVLFSIYYDIDTSLCDPVVIEDIVRKHLRRINKNQTA